MKNIAIFASGNGSNAQRIVEYFYKNQTIQISLILSNKTDAFVLERAKNFDIPAFAFSNDEFYKTERVLKKLNEYAIDFIVLAGFMIKIPLTYISVYPNRIVNIHPALLPKYGGKGMYGDYVHQAVIAAKEKESGITIHYVNEQYDEGAVIFQAKCNIEEDDTPETLAKKVHILEHKYYSEIIKKLLQK